MDGWMDGWMDESIETDGWIDRDREGWMGGWIWWIETGEQMDGWMMDG